LDVDEKQCTGASPQSTNPDLFLSHSSSTLSWPIGLNSSSLSASAAELFPLCGCRKISGRPAKACFFHFAIKFGFTWYSCASSVTVFCALIASTESLAFKVGGYLLRVLGILVSFHF